MGLTRRYWTPVKVGLTAVDVTQVQNNVGKISGIFKNARAARIMVLFSGTVPTGWFRASIYTQAEALLGTVNLSGWTAATAFGKPHFISMGLTEGYVGGADASNVETLMVPSILGISKVRLELQVTIAGTGTANVHVWTLDDN